MRHQFIPRNLSLEYRTVQSVKQISPWCLVLHHKAIVLGLGKERSKMRTHDGEDLKCEDVTNHEHGKEHNSADLDVQLQQAAAGLPVEAAPSVEESNAAGSSEQLPNDLAAKGAVKRHNGVLVFREDGRLDADLSDNSWDAEEEGGEDGEGDGSESADSKAHPLTLSVLLEVVLIQLVEAKEDSNTNSQVHANVGHGGRDGGGRSKGLPMGLARDALPELCIRWHGNNLVGPGSVYVGYSGASKSADKDGLAREAAREEGEKEAGEEVDGEGEKHRVQSMDPESAEASVTTSVGDNVFDGGANARRDGLLVDQCDGRTALKKALLLVLVGWLIGWGDCDGGVGGLDHAEGSDDLLEHVRQLREA